MPYSCATISRRAARRREKAGDFATYSILFEITWQILLFIVLYCCTLSNKSFKAQNKEKAEEEKTAKKRAEKSAEGKETGDYTLSITGNDVKSMTQSLVAESVSISAPDRSSFDIKA